MRALLIATTNAGKLAEIRALLAGVPYDLLALSDLRAEGVEAAERPSIDPPPETGATFAENARSKALYYAARTGLLTVAEDSGLEIDALGGAPGVESARLGGATARYPEKFQLIYQDLARMGLSTSPARFVCAVALAEVTRIVFEARGTVEGQIAPAPRGSGGFGYDPIFFYPPFGCTLAEAGGRKIEVSHRGAAFHKLRAFLERDRREGHDGHETTGRRPIH